MKSLIRNILEAEDVSLNQEPVSAAPPTDGVPMSDADFPPAPAEPAPGAGGPPQMPRPAGGANMTVQKAVLNSGEVKAVTMPLKALVTSFEKLFDDDMTIEQATPHINQFLNNLANAADRLSEIVGQSAGGEEALGSPEPPMPEAPMPAPAPEMAPEAAMPPMPPEGSPEGGMPPEGGMGGGEEFTNPWGGYEDQFTNPNEATL